MGCLEYEPFTGRSIRRANFLHGCHTVKNRSALYRKMDHILQRMTHPKAFGDPDTQDNPNAMNLSFPLLPIVQNMICCLIKNII